MSEPSRYVVGLDLGTTNTAIASIDTRESPDEEPAIRCLEIPQLVKAGEVGAEPLLPSFLYLPGAGEIDPAQLALPWAKNPGHAVGKFARDHGSLVPTRLVSSAKSWLCHDQVDRRGAILPWVAEEEFPKISPLEASARILRHAVAAWNHAVAGRDKESRIEKQEVVLTVPASFDAVARELTVEAAKQAGLEHVTLFEEPQAAFYAWLHAQGPEWRKQVRPGEVVLVVDIGGGTTDLTLIAVGEKDGDLSLERLAVGDHLLLGGDNMDLSLAHVLAAEMKKGGAKLDAAQMLALWHGCRSSKEKLFENPKLAVQPITLLGRGRKVVGGALRTELERQTVERTLVEGFFPKVDADSEPSVASETGLKEFGLAYTADPAVTRHVASFLKRNAGPIREHRAKAAKAAVPDAVLFNGGVFQAGPLRERVVEVLSDWSTAGGGKPPRELPAQSLDRAVAVGAAYYGMVRRGRGVRIRGGVARSYYIGVQVPMPAVPGVAPPIKALCVVPQGMEEGTEAELAGREFGLKVGEPAVFRFLGSTRRRGDTMGTTVEDWEDSIDELAPLTTTLEPGEKDAPGSTVPVRLLSRVTEIGTLELWCLSRDGKRKWKLEFNVRDTVPAE